MGDRQALRHEPTFADLLDDYLRSGEFSRRRGNTQRDYSQISETILCPAWGRMRLKAIQRRDVEALVLFFVSISLSAANATTITFQPTSQTINVEDSTTVDVLVEGTESCGRHWYCARPG